MTLSLHPGQQVDRYEVTRHLGEGPVAKVYSVRDLQLERNAVLKIGREDWLGDAVQEEARLLASLRHPGVIQVWDVGSHQGCGYAVFELLDHPLAEEIATGLPRIESAVQWLYGTVVALDYIHRRGILHLDVGAHTVLLDETGETRLIDFGIAQTLVGSFDPRRVTAGSRRYMAPEQLAGDIAGPHMDVWAFGTLAYELLTGRLPFSVEQGPRGIASVSKLIELKSTDPPPPSALRSSIPPALDALCLSCLATDPQLREDDCGAISKKLRPWLATAPGSRVFVSHAGVDREMVEREIVSALESSGIRTWYCREDIRTASLWERSIVDALESSDWVLVAISPGAIASEWVKDEVHWAIDHRPNRILPVMLQPCDPSELHIRLRRIHVVDLRQPGARGKMLSALGASPTP